MELSREVEVIVIDGLFPGDMFGALARMTPRGDSRTFQRLVELEARRLGFVVERDVRVSDRGDGRSGKVAVVACRGEDVIALELSDRAKSWAKLEAFRGATARAIVRRAA